MMDEGDTLALSTEQTYSMNVVLHRKIQVRNSFCVVVCCNLPQNIYFLIQNMLFCINFLNFLNFFLNNYFLNILL